MNFLRLVVTLVLVLIAAQLAYGYGLYVFDGGWRGSVSSLMWITLAFVLVLAALGWCVRLLWRKTPE